MDNLEPTPLPPLPTRPERQTTRSALLGFLVHHNPFYLLSALCMIAGCYALNSALETRSGELGKLFLLLGVINVYEVLLIALGLYLVVRHRIDRDGRTLLLLETVFLVDLTFLNAETAATSFWIGVSVNSILLVLAFIKVGVVLRALIGRLPTQAYLFICAQLLTLAAMPCGLKWAERHGGITHGAFYSSWWIAGLVLVFYELQTRLMRSNSNSPAEPLIGVARDIQNVYQVVPYLSLLAHLGMLQWVYKTDFYLAYTSPILLGCAVLLARRSPAWLRGTVDASALRVILPLVAVLLSNQYPYQLAVLSGRFAVTPPFVTIAIAYFVYVYAYAIRYALVFVAGAFAVGLTLLFGPSINQIIAAADIAWQWIVSVVRKLIPQTAGQWGIVAVGGAFAFLGLGAFVSLRKRKAAE